MTYYEDDDFKLECHHVYNEHYLHCEVKKWSTKSLKKGFSVFAKLLNEKTQEGVSRLITITPNPKFAALLGGTFVQTINENGKEYEVYQWVLK